MIAWVQVKRFVGGGHGVRVPLGGSSVVAGGALNAHARDYGQYTAAPKANRDWFKGLENRRTGARFCSDADCARTEARTRNDHWDAKTLDGSWIAVPPESIVVDQGDPTGGPILCSYPEAEGDGWVVPCFVPGPDG